MLCVMSKWPWHCVYYSVYKSNPDDLYGQMSIAFLSRGTEDIDSVHAVIFCCLIFCLSDLCLCLERIWVCLINNACRSNVVVTQLEWNYICTYKKRGHWIHCMRCRNCYHNTGDCQDKMFVEDLAPHWHYQSKTSTDKATAVGDRVADKTLFSELDGRWRWWQHQQQPQQHDHQ